MAKHRGAKRRSKKIAVLGAATVTATALTVGVGPAPKAQAAAVERTDAVDLAADFRLFPPPAAIPDITFGAGGAAYDVKNQFADFVFRTIFDNVNLAAFARAAGVDPESILETVLGNLPLALLTDPIFVDLLGGLALPLGTLLNQLPLIESIPLLGVLLNEGINEAGLTTIGGLLDIVGLDLSDPFNLTEVGGQLGLNVITSGHLFTLLKVLGTDLGWTPTLPNSVADEVESTEYLGVGIDGLLELADTGIISIPTLLNSILETLGLGDLDDIPDALKVRVPVVVGEGVGAFAAGMAYQDVLDRLASQPGGVDYNGEEAAPLLGSITVLPMLLYRNPGRANGGLFARLYPLAGLFGIDTVTPDTQVSNSGGIEIPLTNLYLGGATLIPVKIDATVQYDPLSDFAAWPNPFSLLNSLAAAAFPTYTLRGLDTALTAESVTEQLAPQLAEIAAGLLDDDVPLALNLYATLPTDTLPLLEPTYLIFDAINLLTGANLNNPIATALAPALTNLVNLGYTDVERQWNDEGGYWEYVRTFDDTSVPTAFGSFPDINWLNVPGDIAGAFGAGVRQAFEDGLVNRDGPVKNALATLLNLLGLDGGLPGGIGGTGLDGVVDQIRDAVDDLLGGLVPAGGSTLAAVDSVPDQRAMRVSVTTGDDEGDAAADEGAAEDGEVPAGDEGADVAEDGTEDDGAVGDGTTGDEDAVGVDEGVDEGAEDEGAGDTTEDEGAGDTTDEEDAGDATDEEDTGDVDEVTDDADADADADSAEDDTAGDDADEGAEQDRSSDTDTGDSDSGSSDRDSDRGGSSDSDSGGSTGAAA